MHTGERLYDLPATYVSYDLETTGVSATYDRAVEIGAVKVVDGKKTDEFQTFIALPDGVVMNPRARAVNHISDEMLADAPDERKAMAVFAKFIGDGVLIGHNIEKFDNRFIAAAFDRYQLPFVNDYVDTLLLARQMWPGQCNKLEEGVLVRLGITNDAAHRALGDADATSQAYLRMRQMLLEQAAE